MKSEKLLKNACYASGMTMSVTGNLPPLLFITFHNLYNISYSLLGTLIVINFITQLSIDLIFSFFSRKVNIPKTVKAMPVITIAGLTVFSFIGIFIQHKI